MEEKILVIPEVKIHGLNELLKRHAARSRFPNSEGKFIQGKWYNDTKKKFMKEICRQTKIQMFELPNQTRFKIWFEVMLNPACKLDFDNVLSEVMKFTLDALQEAKVLENDSPKFIRRILGSVDYDYQVQSREFACIKVHFYEDEKLGD